MAIWHIRLIYQLFMLEASLDLGHKGDILSGISLIPVGNLSPAQRLWLAISAQVKLKTIVVGILQVRSEMLYRQVYRVTAYTLISSD